MIYLDSAATTLQKPPTVYSAVQNALKTMTSPGRGGHDASALAAKTEFLCREKAANLFDVSDPEHVIITFNATHGLNIAIKSLVKPGSTVVISGYEHNAVTRPLFAIEGVKIRIADGPLFRPDLILQRFNELIDSSVDAVICTHVSNVFGYVLPVPEIAQLCSEKGIPFIVDASQSAGCLPVSLKKWNAAFIAMPGHKGLYGPQGTGLLLCSNDRVCPILEGGTGSESARLEMPEYLPDRLEAGTHNIPGVAGLAAGLSYVEQQGIDSILAHERRLTLRTLQKISRIHQVEVFSLPGLLNQAGVCSFRIRECDCESFADELNKAGIAVRAGLHCAPLAHRSAKTFETGTIRISFSAFNQSSDVDYFTERMSSLLA